MKELISVIVPVYNSEKWIEECCASVLSQSHDNIELIAVNDGSSDSSQAIIEDIARKDSRVKVINTDHFGVSHARNVGLDAAAGEFVAFLDSDDTLERDALNFMYRLCCDGHADIAVCTKAEVSGDGSIKTREFPLPYEKWSGTDGLKASLSDHQATYSVWGKLYRRSVIKDIRFVQGREAHEDSFFVFLCMLKQPTTVVSNTVAVNYRLRENSLSRAANTSKTDDILYFAGEKERIVKNCFPEFSDLAKNVKIKASMSALGILLRISDESAREREMECIKTVITLKRYYIPADKRERKLFFIVCHRMYFPFKFLFCLLRKIKRGICR